MRKLNKNVLILTLSMLMVSLVGCDRESERVSHNISKEADNFGVVRRLSVVSAINNEPIFELVGAFSFEEQGHRITTTVKTGANSYKKHTVGLSQMTFWVVEDLEGANVNNYKYEINFTPKMIQPFDVKYKSGTQTNFKVEEEVVNGIKNISDEEKEFEEFKRFQEMKKLNDLSEVSE